MELPSRWINPPAAHKEGTMDLGNFEIGDIILDKHHDAHYEMIIGVEQDFFDVLRYKQSISPIEEITKLTSAILITNSMRPPATKRRGIKMTKGNTYRHRSTTEMDMHILKIIHLAPDGLTLEVSFVNRHYGWLYEPETVTVKTEEMKNWRLV